MAVTKGDARRCIVWFGQPAGNERARLTKAGWFIRVAEAGGNGGAGMRNGNTVVALADLRQSDAASIEIMEHMMADHPGLPWLSLIAPDMPAQEPSVSRILQASADFFTEPVDLQRLLDSLAQLGGEVPALEPGDVGITGHSQATRAVTASVRKYAPVELPVLITGETGTGKEVAARAAWSLHAQRASLRSDQLRRLAAESGAVRVVRS